MTVPRNNLEAMMNKLNRGPAAQPLMGKATAKLSNSGTAGAKSSVKGSEAVKAEPPVIAKTRVGGNATASKMGTPSNAGKATPAPAKPQLPRAQDNVATPTFPSRHAVPRLTKLPDAPAKPSTPVLQAPAFPSRKRVSDEGMHTSASKRFAMGANSPMASSTPQPEGFSESLEKLNAKLVKHQAKKIELLEQKMGEDDEDDQEMTQGMIDLVSSRIKEVMRKIAAFDTAAATSSPTPTPVPVLYQTPPPPAAQVQQEAPAQDQDQWETASVVSIADTEVDEPIKDIEVPVVVPERSTGIRSATVASSSRAPDSSTRSRPPPPPARAEASSTRTYPPPQSARGRPRTIPDYAAQYNGDVDMEREAEMAIEAERKHAAQAIDVAEALKDFEDIGDLPMEDWYESSPPPQAIAVVAPVKATPKKPEEVHPWSKEVASRLRQVFKLTGFRENQKTAVDATMAGKDVFVLMPTGGGKSLCYQLPAICNMGKTSGVTFVISPLLSLISDQTAHLIKLGIPAIAFTGALKGSDKRKAMDMLERAEPLAKIVYTTPESLDLSRADNDLRRLMDSLYRRQKLARFVIDEAHCVSSWGHDFRPHYRDLGNLKEQYRGVPFMALTATANIKVRKDILDSLGMENAVSLQQSFNRPNLYYEVRPKRGGKNLILDISAFIAVQPKGASGIIYCSSKDKCEDVATQLRDQHSLRAYHYHAGMKPEDRIMVQTEWQDHKFEIIVATIAFGMGIDKPDVRFVIHHTLPRSLEGYYQETGRAGRDGANATCALFYSYGDSKNTQNFIDRDTELNAKQKEHKKEQIKEVMRFCINKVDCRRTQILRYFAENFDPAHCNNTCDVCCAGGAQIVDVTEAAADAIRVVADLDSQDRVTTKGGVERFLKNYKQDKTWKLGEAERLFEQLLINGQIDLMHVANRSGFYNSYLKPAPARMTNPVVKGTQRILMGFSKAPASGQDLKGKGKRIAPKARTPANAAPNPISRQQSLQRIAAQTAEFDHSPWEDLDGDFEGIDSGSPQPRQVKATKSRATKAKPVYKSASLVDVNDLTDEEETAPEYLCLQDLNKLRESIASSEKKARSAILDDEVTELLATLLPNTTSALSQIDGMTPEKITSYGSRILECCQKYRPVTAPRAAASKPAVKPMERVKSLAFSGSGVRPMTVSAPSSVRQRRLQPSF